MRAEKHEKDAENSPKISNYHLSVEELEFSTMVSTIMQAQSAATNVSGHLWSPTKSVKADLRAAWAEGKYSQWPHPEWMLEDHDDKDNDDPGMSIHYTLSSPKTVHMQRATW